MKCLVIVLTLFHLYEAWVFIFIFTFKAVLFFYFLGIISEVPCLFFVMMCIVWALAKESAMSKNQIQSPSLWLKYVKI